MGMNHLIVLREHLVWFFRESNHRELMNRGKKMLAYFYDKDCTANQGRSWHYVCTDRTKTREEKEKRKKKFLHFLKIPLTKKEFCIYYSLLLRLMTIVHVAAAVGKNWILSPPSPCLYTLFNVCPLFINNALDGEVHDQKVGEVKGIKFRGT